jgi:3-phosphoshikimate 1-carboxyvinyltransferase
MRERPIGDLLDALNQLGDNCTCENRPGFPPLMVNASGLRGGNVNVRGDVSSQFLSGLMLASPYAASDVYIHIQGSLVSKPYVEMTRQIMAAFGATVVAEHDFSAFRIAAPQKYAARQYLIEPDASAASYFWAAAAITGGEVTIEGLSRDSLQGDVQFVECLTKMGCRVNYSPSAITVSGRAAHGIDIDMNAISDTAQTLAVVALFANGPTTIRGVAHIRHKETDRIGDLARELRKFGATVDELPDGLRIHPPPLPLGEGWDEGACLTHLAGTNTTSIEIETYNDHRMAMSFALAGLVHPGVVIRDPGCTAKTYPRFFDDLQRVINSPPGGGG